MGQPMRITFKDKDFVFQIITKDANEVEILINGDEVGLIKNEHMIWTQKDGTKSLDPAFVQAIGRSISLRLRM